MNQESLSFEPLYGFPKDQLFYTEDNYCFLIDELLDILIKQNKHYNPYTNSPLPANDLTRLLAYPPIKAIKNNRKLKNLHLE